VTRTGAHSRKANSSAKRASASGARRRPGAWGRGGVLFFLAKAVAATLFGVVVVAGLFYVRLMNGPIALNFLVSTFEKGIAEELADKGVHIQSVSLRLSDAGLLQFDLGNVRVIDGTGEPLIMAPSAVVSLSRRALLLGRIAVESLDLVSARLTLFYADDGTLSLKFSPSSHPATTGPQPDLRGSVAASEPAASSPADSDWTLGRIDLIRMLSEASARARRGEHVGAYLREVGLRSATVIIDNGTRKTIWHLPEFDLDLDHRRTRSSIAGRAKIESLAGPWEVTFRTYEHVNTNALNLAVSVQNLVPRGLAHSFPQLVGLEGLDLPVSGDAQFVISTAGEVLGGKIVIDAAPGNVALPWLAANPMRIDGARFELSYSSAMRRFDIAPSVLKWGDSRLQFTGTIVHASQGADGPGWHFDLRSTEGSLAPEPPDLQRLPIDAFSVRGLLAPERGKVVLSQFVLRAGGAEVTAHADVSNVGGDVKGQLDAKIGPMSAAVFKTLWPRWVAPLTRTWVVRRLARGDVLGGSFKVVRGAGPSGADWAPVGNGDRVSFSLEGANLELQVANGWPALEMPRGLLRLEGRSVEFTVPEATMAAADGRKFSLKGSLAIDLDEPMPRTGRLALKGQGPLTLALEMLDQNAQRALQEGGITVAGIEGNVEGSVNVKLPLTPQFEMRDSVVEGRLRISDGKLRNVLGSYDAQGVNLTIELSAAAADAKAEFLIKGVPARATWQRVFDAPAERQPPLRITATLDNSERTQLGLDINDIVQGVVGIDIEVEHDARGERHVHLSADLTNAELFLESLAWRKPTGRPAAFEFDLAKGTTYPIELRNVKLHGENVAMAGWMGAGADFRVKEFRFPQFSLNVVTSFEAHGKLRSDNVWEVSAKGPVFDGKDMFQSFFDVNVAPDRGAKHRPGLDLRAEVDTVVGFYETSLRGVRLSMHKRAGKMNQLEVRGTFAPNKQFEAGLRHEPGGPRLLVAKSNDAGQTFKLVGFYPHAVGGDMSLEVNLDGQGVAERTGILTASRFQILGDTISVQNLPDTPARRSVVRERFEFDTLRAPFSVGHGQFILENAAIQGPLVSATMVGKLDFRTRVLQVGGTFTPLSSLNKVFSDIPLFGELLTGPKREGVFAINYALQGGLENPQLIVNPFSAVTPGITRELMQIAPQDPRIVPRKQQPASKNEGGVRSSSSPVAGPGTVQDAGGGWSSETDMPAVKKR
jgi:AsmA-like C-terminal region